MKNVSNAFSIPDPVLSDAILAISQKTSSDNPETMQAIETVKGVIAQLELEDPLTVHRILMHLAMNDFIQPYQGMKLLALLEKK